MTIVDILGLEKFFEGSIDLEKKTFELKFLNFSIKGIKYSSIKALNKDIGNTERILSELFIRKQVMWQDLARERVDYCIQSLEDLKQRCDDKSKGFGATKNEEDKFYATLLLRWADECDIAIKEFLTAKIWEKDSLEMDFGSGSYMRAHEEIPRIIGTFRAGTLPAVSELAKLLPQDNPVRVDTEQKTNYAIKTIISTYGMLPQQIPDGQYAIE